MISKENVLLVRQRANFQCEYCQVSETDSGGELTIDHYWPSSKGGLDDLTNLVYACPRCNLYKHDYYPSKERDLVVFNPRIEVFQEHFLMLDNGQLHPLSTIADFTIKLLRLNRSPLIAYRIEKKKQVDLQNQLAQMHDLTKLLQEVNRHLIVQSIDQQKLLQEQNLMLNAILRGKKKK